MGEKGNTVCSAVLNLAEDAEACPSCGKKRCFVRYIDEQGTMRFPSTVGKCDHEQSCGYHYTPREYFRDNSEAMPNDDRCIFR